MPRKRDFFHTGLQVSRSDLAGLPWSMYGANPTGAQDYFVDGNALISEVGTHQDTPMTTLAEAIAASNISIALSSNRWWARRNRIFVCGDRLDEDLTTFPTKCDIIGVGSCDAFQGVGILGNHTPTGEHYGTRWINCNFFPGASLDIMTLGNAGSGIEFLACRFLGAWGAFTAPSAFQFTGHAMAKVIGNIFEGAFSGDVIDICAGDASGMKIIGNEIVGGANDGIVVSGVATVVGATSRGVIRDNFIQVAAVCLDTRATSVFNVYNNNMISAAAATSPESYTIDLTHASNNYLTGNSVSIVIPDISTN